MRIVRRNYDGDDHDDDEDDDGGVHITMLVTLLIGVMRMSIYVTWKYDEDSFRQENDNGGTIELNAAEIYSKFTKQFIEIHPHLQHIYTGHEKTRLWNVFFWSFLSKSKREWAL